MSDFYAKHQEALDELVHEELSREASDINNKGYSYQVWWLLNRNWKEEDLIKRLEEMDDGQRADSDPGQATG